MGFGDAHFLNAATLHTISIIEPESFLDVIRLMCTATEPVICPDCKLKETCDDTVFIALPDFWSMANRLKRWIEDRVV